MFGNSFYRYPIIPSHHPLTRLSRVLTLCSNSYRVISYLDNGLAIIDCSSGLDGLTFLTFSVCLCTIVLFTFFLIHFPKRKLHCSVSSILLFVLIVFQYLALRVFVVFKNPRSQTRDFEDVCWDVCQDWQTLPSPFLHHLSDWCLFQISKVDPVPKVPRRVDSSSWIDIFLPLGCFSCRLRCKNSGSDQHQLVTQRQPIFPSYEGTLFRFHCDDLRNSNGAYNIYIYI